MRHQDHDAHRAFEASALHAGCSGDCEWGEPCSCSHSAWRAPRQPRKPASVAWPSWKEAAREVGEVLLFAGVVGAAAGLVAAILVFSIK